MEIVGVSLLFVVSLATLVMASDRFVRVSEVIGLALGVSPFVIGVTLVAFGTSLPELASSIAAVLTGNSEIVVGNVVGSNVTNILLVLGLTAVVGGQINLSKWVIDVEIPLLVASALLLWLTLYDGKLALFEALILVSGIIIFLFNAIQDKPTTRSDVHKAGFKHYAVLVIAAGLIYAGAHFTILSIVQIALRTPLSPEVIALTGVALGTSLPEVAVSVAAARRGSAEMAVGNVLGSNIFNSFAVMGIPALIGELIIPDGIRNFSLPLMLGVTFLFGIVCLTPRINKWIGWTLLLFYVFFLYRAFEV
jgi:cation:H+ antiporter